MITLTRFCYSSKGTFGLLEYAELDLYTVERPWRQNEVSVSCIPEGTYRLGLTSFRGKYETLEIEGVPGRSEIKIHVANSPSDLSGCVGVGLNIGVLGTEWSVVASQSAFDLFWDAVSIDPPRIIQIRQGAGTVLVAT